MAVDGALVLWFSLTVLSVAYVAWDLSVRTPAMTVMKWGWVAVVAYTGPIGLFVYLLSCREPSPGSHEAYVAPLWKQAVGSTIHCLAGDATGIIAASTITAVAGLPMGIDLIVEYAAGFAFGLLIFQALFMRDILGGSYRTALRRTVLPEWLSMNNVMAGMAPVMAIAMSRDSAAGEPTSLRFWGIMSAATLTGGLLAYPVNVWLVARGLKHGMGTVRALGAGGEGLATTAQHGQKTADPGPHTPGRPVRRRELAAIAAATLLCLAVGLILAAMLGSLG
ncbi:MAG: DUF4396 domain-containing protein [Gaiellaceae bacterium]